MKKKLIVAILAGCMLALCACNTTVNVNSNAGASSDDQAKTEAKTEDTADDKTIEAAEVEDAEDTADSDEERKSKEIQPDADGVLSNGLFTITVPKKADGLYLAYATDNSIGLYDKAANADGFGGYVFSIQAYSDPAQYGGGLDLKVGEIRNGDTTYDMTVMEATDVQWDYNKSPDMPESYSTIYSCKEDVIASIKPVDGGEFVAGGGTSGEELYGDVIDQFKKAISEGWDGEKLEKNKMSSMYYAIAQYDGGANAMQSIGYAFVDLNSDGVDELCVGEISDGDWKGVIYDIYTMVDRKPTHVVSGYERDRYYALKGGIILNEASGGAELTETVSYYLEPNSTEMIPQIAVKYDSYDDEANPWYKSNNYEKGEWEKITEDEYNEYVQRISDVIRFDYTPFGN